MGLDAVEIIMKVEETYDIQIEDSEAEKLLTPGQLIDLILVKTSDAQPTGCLTQRAFNLLRSFCVRSWAFNRNRIRPAVALQELLPPYKRPQFIQALGASLAIATPRLERPQWLVASLMAGATLSGLAVAIISIHLGVNSWMPGLMTIAVVGFLAARATNRLRTEFPKGLVTIGDLSSWVMSCKPDLAVPTKTAWAREQVAERVKTIVIDQLGCAAAYREEAHFIKDLGLG
jgi:acyl carrier protein